MVAVREICLGFDVGKAAHQACAVCRTTGKVLSNDHLDNKEDSIDEVLGSAGVEALVVVDQKRNIGALVPERARSAGMDVAYLPGLPMKRSRDMLPGIAKTDEIAPRSSATPLSGCRGRLGPLLKTEGRMPR